MTIIFTSCFKHEDRLTSHNHSTISWCLPVDVCCHCRIGSRIIKISSGKGKEENRWLLTHIQILLTIDITNQGMCIKLFTGITQYKMLMKDTGKAGTDFYWSFSQLSIQAALTWAHWKWPSENAQSRLLEDVSLTIPFLYGNFFLNPSCPSATYSKKEPWKKITCDACRNPSSYGYSHQEDTGIFCLSSIS